MLTFAAITPHPPILIPSIGKENLKKDEENRRRHGGIGEKNF